MTRVERTLVQMWCRAFGHDWRWQAMPTHEVRVRKCRHCEVVQVHRCPADWRGKEVWA